MYVQIVSYNLNGVSEQDYIDIAHQVAPQFSAMAGLQAKVWLHNEDSNAYGAVYFWDDRESQERFVASDLFEATYPGFANVASEGYEVFEHLTRATQPVLEILEEEVAGWAPPPPPPSEPIEEAELVDEVPELEPDEEPELVEDLEAVEELEPVEEVEPVDAVVVQEPAPPVRVTRRVVKRPVKKAPKKAAAKKAAAKKAAAKKAARSTKVIKLTKKAASARRAATPRVTKVTKKVVKRPVKKAKKAKKLR
ncbi:MAG: YdhR family protein [Actinomycetota bacterium]|nr:YdhR family protein [Actinomycetota bacterium]